LVEANFIDSRQPDVSLLLARYLTPGNPDKLEDLPVSRTNFWKWLV
jgi:hypothetical protein